MTMAAESNGSCSTAVAPLDLVDEVAEEDVPALVALPEAVVEFEVELDTGGCVSERVEKENQEEDIDHWNMSGSQELGPRSSLEMNNSVGRWRR